eukprot:CAMPEP_0185262670 /NCGR_PEP_ID=MMETSP1359-20130426/10758_1 /TAXON_ID=552665 /ORGANISM="Bigelowiella longifila, Strain CCMP242" /LENGTH=88 /DNA_ID=CAMNT_0027849681 /DNA_START=1258 /DNA_END=1524 /DNA_ORIENTATION=+
MVYDDVAGFHVPSKELVLAFANGLQRDLFLIRRLSVPPVIRILSREICDLVQHPPSMRASDVSYHVLSLHVVQRQPDRADVVASDLPV